MGMSAGNRSGKRYQAMSDINVTPLVDVMLVLLIVFMVTAPLLTVGVDVELPESSAAPLSQPEEPLVVTLAKDGLYIQESTIQPEQMVERLQAIVGERDDTVIYVRADKTLPYGDIMGIMGQINAAGFRKVALITDALQE